MSTPAPKTSNKFARYRAKKREQGLRQIRLWVPDVHAPGFQERLDEQLRAARDSEEEREVMAWVEAVTADMQLPPYGDPDPTKQTT